MNKIIGFSHKILKTVSRQFIQKRNLPEYYYDMPREVSNLFYQANADMQDNLNWFYYNAVEVAYPKLIKKILDEPDMNPHKGNLFLKNIILKTQVCNSLLHMHIPVTRKNGLVQIIEGYCSQHGLDFPTYLGGNFFVHLYNLFLL